MGLFKLDLIRFELQNIDIYKTWIVCKNPNTPRLLHVLLIPLLLACNLLKWAIFGSLSPVEVRHLKDKISYTIWEFCVGFPLFLYTTRKSTFEELGLQFWKFAGLFLCILLLKSFHYLCVDRAKVIFSTSGSNKFLFSACLRFSIGLTLVNFVDIILIHRFFYELYFSPTDTKNNILMAIFGFEILNIFPLVILTTIRFGLEFHEYTRKQNSPLLHRWFDVKQKILKISEFLTNLLRFTMTCIFAIYFLYYYTFPLHILPSSYLTFKVLVIKTRSLINYKKSQIRISKLVVPESASCFISEPNCIICLDELHINSNLVQFPKCFHSYHLNCIKSWLDYSSDCPICRQAI